MKYVRPFLDTRDLKFGEVVRRRHSRDSIYVGPKFEIEEGDQIWFKIDPNDDCTINDHGLPLVVERRDSNVTEDTWIEVVIDWGSSRCVFTRDDIITSSASFDRYVDGLKEFYEYKNALMERLDLS